MSVPAEREREAERGRERTLWSLLAVEPEQSGASGVSGPRGLRGQGLLAVGDIKPSD